MGGGGIIPPNCSVPPGKIGGGGGRNIGGGGGGIAASCGFVVPPGAWFGYCWKPNCDVDGAPASPWVLLKTAATISAGASGGW